MSPIDVDAKVDVLIILASLRAEGTPRLALDLCRYWKKRGVRVAVATLADEPRDLEIDFQAAGVYLHSFDLQPVRGYQRYLSMTRECSRLVRSLSARSVLSGLFGWHAFLLLGARFGGAHLTAAHVGSAPLARGVKFWKFYLQVKLGQAVTNKLICCSDYVALQIKRKFSLSGRNVTRVYNGCDVSKFKMYRQPDAVKRRSAGHVVGMVASLELSKDHRTLIDAIGLLRKQELSIELWLVGDGAERQALIDYVGERRLTGTIKFLGTRNDIPELLQRMDVFCFSVNQEEGLGIALIEAMVAKVPIVATGVPASKEVLDEGNAGLLSKPGDAVDLGDKIREAIENPQAAGRRAEFARERALRVFSSEIMAEEYARALKLC